jgi:peptide methionine sulfoxide reductase msrA/msrB
MRTLIALLMLVGVLLVVSCQSNAMNDTMDKTMTEQPAMTQTAVFAGGCFWCTESDFEKVDGVIDAVSGYTGGHVANPTYKQVSSGTTGHIESVKVIYDPSKVTYEQLLDVFWRHVNPTDPGGQFVDRGKQYRSAIFYANDTERMLAEKSKKPWPDRDSSTSRLSPKSCRLARSTRPRTIIRTTTRPIRSGTNFIAAVRAGISSSKKYGPRIT